MARLRRSRRRNYKFCRRFTNRAKLCRHSSGSSGEFAALTKPVTMAGPQTLSSTASFGLAVKFNLVSGFATSAVTSCTRAGDGRVFVAESLLL
jgi:hypothetical protein